MLKNVIRNGNITSSGAYHLIAGTTAQRQKQGFLWGVTGDTYIKEINWERKLGRSLDKDVDAKPMKWGSLVEKRAFEVLPLSYQLISDETIVHPRIPYWVGTPDGIKGNDTVIDIKCPFTMESYCQFADCTTIEQVRKDHKDGEKYYWQIVSNAILLGMDKGELIIYCPYQSELPAIREMANNVAVEDMHKYYFIANAFDDDLPYLLDGGHYKNIHIIAFDIPKEDKELLISRVLAAGKHLITPNTIIASRDADGIIIAEQA